MAVLIKRANLDTKQYIDFFKNTIFLILLRILGSRYCYYLNFTGAEGCIVFKTCSNC